MSVLVYLVDPDSKVKETARLFHNKIFNFHTFKAQTPSGTIGQQLTNHSATELHTYLMILQDAKRQSPNSHVIILDNRMISSIDSKYLASLISRITSRADIDIFYLSKYLDRCDLYDHQERLAMDGQDNGLLLSQTYQPNGIQALMFSPYGRDVVLGQQEGRRGRKIAPFNQPLNSGIRQAVANGDLSAFTVSPNIFSFDLSRSRDASDLMRLNECLPSPTSNTTTSSSVWWFIIIIVIVLIIAGIAVFLSSGSRKAQ